MKRAYQEIAFTHPSRVLIEQANAIINEYFRKGYTLTLRQLYYQFVARELLENTVRSYKRLGNLVNNARMAGLIDWDAIEDRTRWLREIPNFSSPDEYITHVIEQYAEDLWRDQNTYCEVWVEKDALSSVVARACNEWRVPYFPCRGYGSQSELYTAGRRLKEIAGFGVKRVTIFHLGDHDPSGIDMTRDNQERLSLFAGFQVRLQRLALNMDQVEQYDPPENPAKETDSRFAGYTEQFNTDSSWELDALEPSIIEGLITDAIQTVIDVEKFRALAEEETANRDRLRKIADNFEAVQQFVDNIE